MPHLRLRTSVRGSVMAALRRAPLDATLGSLSVSPIVGQVQSAVVGKIHAVNQASEASEGGVSAANLVDAAQQNIDSLVNQSSGLGAIVNIRV